MSVNYVLSVLWFWRLHILYLKSAQSKWQLDYEWLLIWIFRICKYKTFIYISFFYNLFNKIYFFRNMGMGISASNWATELIKNQKNPYGELMGVIDIFQSSSYNSFSLKLGCVKNTPSPHKIFVSLSVSYWAT